MLTLNRVPPYLTCSEGISNLCNDGLISGSDGGRCKHKYKVEDEGIPGIFLIIDTARRPHNAVARYTSTS